ncbi:MAG: ribonuclease H-like domain-containing protein [Dehalococcoidia bacterium]|nr:ribonuclease H-like domain-containing protein [Dehalococcoidia bacterium]
MKDAYLDIETTGLSPGDCKITIIGIHLSDGIEDGFVQLVGDEITPDNLLAALAGVKTIHTYNGSRFDMPFIAARLGVDLTRDFDHCDLMYDCWRNNLYGGLKRVERTLGIARRLVDINGLEAVRLWWRYENDYDREALRILCEYNREDVVNLKTLKEKVVAMAGVGMDKAPDCGTG